MLDVIQIYTKILLMLSKYKTIRLINTKKGGFL